MTKLFKLFILVIFCLQTQNSFANTFLQPKSKFMDDNVELMRQYLSPTDSYNRDEIDTIIVCGSNRIEVLITAFQEFINIYKKGKTINIIFTGGIAADTLLLYQSQYVKSRTDKNGVCHLENIGINKRLFPGPAQDVQKLWKKEQGSLTGNSKMRNYVSEAEIFADMFILLLKKYNIQNYNYFYAQHPFFANSCINIVMENQSMSTSDNFYRVNLLLESRNIGKVLVIQKPLIQRRAYLSALKYFSLTTFFNVTFVEKLSQLEMVIEFNKIVNFMAKSIIAKQEIPIKITNAHKFLCAN